MVTMQIVTGSSKSNFVSFSQESKYEKNAAVYKCHFLGVYALGHKKVT